MPYSEQLADRARKVLAPHKKHIEEKKMMGGLTFMLRGKMCVGILKEELMCRIDPEFHNEAIKKKGCRTMDFTKKPMRGFVFVDPKGTSAQKDLEYWIALAVDFNAKAKASKKK